MTGQNQHCYCYPSSEAEAALLVLHRKLLEPQQTAIPVIAQEQPTTANTSQVPALHSYASVILSPEAAISQLSHV